MSCLTKVYTNLNHALDEVRPVLVEWSATQNEGPSGETVRYAQLVLHEWIANLLQHAEFQNQPPVVEIRLSAENRHIFCTVIDTSEGFDLGTHLPTDNEPIESLPERGMGLRIIDACTDSLSYSSTETGHQRFEFSIPANHEPWLSMLF